MKRYSLDPEDRRTFNRWARAVAAFYGMLAVFLVASIVYSLRAPDGGNAALRAGDVALSDLSRSAERHR